VSNRDCVLVVDEIPDTAEVLEAVLASRGLTVNRVRHLDSALPPTLANRPALIVVDVESCASPNARTCDDWQNVPQVIIGTMQAPEAADDVPHGGTPERRYLQKPFQFADLIQAIDALIAADRRHVFRSDR
jgi:DNA-binding response OmpR family regulator